MESASFRKNVDNFTHQLHHTFKKHLGPLHTKSIEILEVKSEIFEEKVNVNISLIPFGFYIFKIVNSIVTITCTRPPFMITCDYKMGKYHRNAKSQG